MRAVENVGVEIDPPGHSIVRESGLTRTCSNSWRSSQMPANTPPRASSPLRSTSLAEPSENARRSQKASRGSTSVPLIRSFGGVARPERLGEALR